MYVALVRDEVLVAGPTAAPALDPVAPPAPRPALPASQVVSPQPVEAATRPAVIEVPEASTEPTTTSPVPPAPISPYIDLAEPVPPNPASPSVFDLLAGDPPPDDVSHDALPAAVADEPLVVDAPVFADVDVDPPVPVVVEDQTPWAPVDGEMSSADQAPEFDSVMPGDPWQIPLDEGRFALGGWAASAGHSIVSAVTFRKRLAGDVATGQIVLEVDVSENVPEGGVTVLSDPGFGPDRDGFTLLLEAAETGPFSAAGSDRVLPTE